MALIDVFLHSDVEFRGDQVPESIDLAFTISDLCELFACMFADIEDNAALWRIHYWTSGDDAVESARHDAVQRFTDALGRHPDVATPRSTGREKPRPGS